CLFGIIICSDYIIQ
ncbi:hypothetical protein Zm00014a_038236, partial [Zea mays]